MTYRGKLIFLIVTIVLLFLTIALGKPIYAQVIAPAGGDVTWVQVLAQPETQSCPVDVSENFGRQLDTLTSFYETVIDLLLVALAVVAAFAFWTISFMSKAKAEEIARDEAGRFVAGEKFRASVDAAVAESVAERMADYDRIGEELQMLYERLDRSAERPGSDDGPNVGDDDDGNS